MRDGSLGIALEAHPRVARIIEAVRIADVLESRGEPDATDHALAEREVSGAAGQLDVRRAPGGWQRQRVRAPHDLAHRLRPDDRLARDDLVAVREGVLHAQ